jgi:hypothetical protein
MISRKIELLLSSFLVFGLVEFYLFGVLLPSVYFSPSVGFEGDNDNIYKPVIIVLVVPFVGLLNFLFMRFYRMIRNCNFMSKLFKKMTLSITDALDYVNKTRQKQNKLLWLYVLEVMMNGWAGNIEMFQIGYSNVIYHSKIQKCKYFSELMITKEILDILFDKQTQNVKYDLAYSKLQMNFLKPLIDIVRLYRAKNYEETIREATNMEQMPIAFLNLAVNVMLFRSYDKIGDEENAKKYKELLKNGEKISSELAVIIDLL